MGDFHAALIAGTHSGVGKTTWSLALMAFFRKGGLKVQPFKVGPDYIDPGFHHLACAPRKSRNLDRFFLSEGYLRRSFGENSSGADLAVVEGVMGLFDGRSVSSEEGSTAQMGKLLDLPVFLVLDGSGLATSAAAMVKGYQLFDPDLPLKGVLINGLGSEGHFHWLRQAIEKGTGLPVLGWLPKDPNVSIPERHLGLRTALEEEQSEEKLRTLANLLEGRFDSAGFLDLTRRPALPVRPPVPKGAGGGKCLIAVAYDRAFSFYYEDNFDLFREAGAEIVFFSPLSDEQIPEGTDALYFGGGFPEIYQEPLSANEAMQASIRRYYEAGGMIYAECGGLIYLCEIGLIPGKIRMTERLQNFGYHEIEGAVDTFLFPKGKKLRSHEFHYSIWEQGGKEAATVRPYRIQEREEGFYDGRLLASYQHLHFGQDPQLARNFVNALVKQKRQKYVPSNSDI